MSVEFDSSLKITFKRKWSTRRTPQTIQDEGDALWSSYVYMYVVIPPHFITAGMIRNFRMTILVGEVKLCFNEYLFIYVEIRLLFEECVDWGLLRKRSK